MKAAIVTYFDVIASLSDQLNAPYGSGHVFRFGATVVAISTIVLMRLFLLRLRTVIQHRKHHEGLASLLCCDAVVGVVCSAIYSLQSQQILQFRKPRKSYKA